MDKIVTVFKGKTSLGKKASVSRLGKTKDSTENVKNAIGHVDL